MASKLCIIWNRGSYLLLSLINVKNVKALILSVQSSFGGPVAQLRPGRSALTHTMIPTEPSKAAAAATAVLSLLTPRNVCTSSTPCAETAAAGLYQSVAVCLTIQGELPVSLTSH